MNLPRNNVLVRMHIQAPCRNLDLVDGMPENGLRILVTTGNVFGSDTDFTSLLLRASTKISLDQHGGHVVIVACCQHIHSHIDIRRSDCSSPPIRQTNIINSLQTMYMIEVCSTVATVEFSVGAGRRHLAVAKKVNNVRRRWTVCLRSIKVVVALGTNVAQFNVEVANKDQWALLTSGINSLHHVPPYSRLPVSSILYGTLHAVVPHRWQVNA
jgi:hypothetical protein